MDEVKDFFARHRVDALQAVPPTPIKEVPPLPAKLAEWSTKLTDWDKWAEEQRQIRLAKKQGKQKRQLPHLVFPKKKTHCFICGTKGKALTKHHTKPSVGVLKREGPSLRLCAKCHRLVHKQWSNQELRQFTFEEFLFLIGKIDYDAD